MRLRNHKSKWQVVGDDGRVRREYKTKQRAQMCHRLFRLYSKWANGLDTGEYTEMRHLQKVLGEKR